MAVNAVKTVRVVITARPLTMDTDEVTVEASADSTLSSGVIFSRAAG